MSAFLTLPPAPRRLCLGGVVGLALACWLAGCGGKAPPPRPPAQKAATNSAPATATAPAALPATNTFVGEFVDEVQSGGLDPFFPKSARRLPPRVAPVPTSTPTEPPPEPPPKIAPNLVLRAIVTSQNRRLAVINNRTFGVGEEGTVKSGKTSVQVKLLEIKNRIAVVQVDGERFELSFRPTNR